MTIEILPARLANQIAAGEVVERPASVIKELVENSLDADATAIHIEVDKGGVKRIRISDNGTGIAKDELTLALSRHATSKIKSLNDLEAINSLGFRGEALASISSVARLTLTSKPQSQPTAWQANAEGRDMAVTITPAAHPDGTTIEVLDLFFNTPARRKFLRTEKTEFNHIDEVIRRIALARFDVTFTLTHNGKTIRQYRAATNKAQNAKRVAMVCGQKFIDHAIEIDCQHDNMRFTGWLAKPSFARNQNDLSYSYVNGRMMRDKLINHAIRQAYANLLPADTYPAFVLFLALDYREVDVNVHPAKHEVRFHQSRYVHDFIYSVCHKALMSKGLDLDLNDEVQTTPSAEFLKEPSKTPSMDNVQYTRPDYIQSLQQVKEATYTPNVGKGHFGQRDSVTRTAVQNYQQLMTPAIAVEHEEQAIDEKSSVLFNSDKSEECFFLAIKQGSYGVFKHQNSLHLLSLFELAYQINKNKIAKSWQQSRSDSTTNLVSQPLLLPVVLTLSKQQMNTVKNHQALLELAGVFCVIQNQTNGKQQLQIRQFPAILRDRDVSTSFITIIEALLSKLENDSNHPKIDFDSYIVCAIASAMIATEYSVEQAQALWLSAKKELSDELIETVLLNSVPLDLTSEIKQLKAKLQTKKN
ncbi:DNA mismatch repair endonuclease MutL [Candidatus Colwellia aromaticivorans]|uniref:DNA mismatch repair endonuclease MutL n=1 Tax=Candidatus Colwellia aromaticivorans TaxID=2267621 RepID=UPI000DF453D2|nr:DNA mismatch repair endonuclease MutL [Candidatus Colwellia aromaticivorans]